MSLTEKDAFKLGFLARCAEEQLRGEALEQRIAAAGAWADNEKTASGWVKFSPFDLGGGSLGGLNSAAWSALKGIGMAGAGILTAPFPVVALGGGAAGYGAAKMLEPDVSDEDVKAQELAATYKLYADKAKARRKSRKYRLERGSEY